MGTCISKDARARRKERRRQMREMNRLSRNRNAMQNVAQWNQHGISTSNDVRIDIQKLIRDTLEVIRSLVNNDQEPPRSLLKLNMIADEARGWLLVVKALIYTIPDDDPLGPAVISLFLDECPLPSKETVRTLLVSLDISKEFVAKEQMTPSWHKNMCIVLGALAEKLAGSSAVHMFNEAVQGYLMSVLSYGLPFIPTSYQKQLKESELHQVRIFALLALEKFAQTRENQLTISNLLFNQEFDKPLHRMVEYLSREDMKNYWFAKQSGFCAQWALDNIFEDSRRSVYSYETTDTTNINAMLNHSDVSEYLKIGPDGLEARCDVSSFESVRCTFEALAGIWYYEATVLTSGVMQIGLATKRSRFLNHEGYGIGDDSSSVAYDGCRQLVWYNARSEKHQYPTWKAGDVVGVLLNIQEGYVQFYLNGKPTSEKHFDFLATRQESEGVFAAASFMSYQQCRFNFGAKPFEFPPKGVAFENFNSHGVLTKQQKTILPKKLRLEQLQKEVVPDDYCQICCASPSDTKLLPCRHDGFCEDCSIQMEQCPLCRVPIEDRITVKADYSQISTRSLDHSSSRSEKENEPEGVSGGIGRKSSRAGSFIHRRDTVVSLGSRGSGTLRTQTQVEGRFFVNDRLQQLTFDELRKSVENAGYGGFPPAVRQISNVAALPGIVGHSIGLPDMHSGYGFSIGNVAAFDVANKDAVISPGGVGFDINCGVRLIRTNLFEKDVEPVKEELAQNLFNHIPVGVGSRGAIPMSARDIVECLEMGMDWTVREGFSWVEDKEHCEEYGRMLQADASKVSTRAKKRGLPQLGTLGSGNHYTEVQVVDEIYDQHAASKMGIDQKGQVVVMVHCGSRGLGHQVATDSLLEMEKVMARDNIVVNDKQLACARINSQEGQNYLAGMAAAANFAWVNRACINFCVRKAFAKTFTMSPDDLDMQLIYDVSHNVAKMEEHLVDGRPKLLCVHRKGATRAFGPHHPLIPVDYQLTGQPILIGGSMGTCSYVLTGTEQGMVETFGTTCHGAGRAWSRSASRNKLKSEDVIEGMAKKNISIRVASPNLIKEEAPESYKDVTDVIDTCHAGGISKRAVKLRPIAVIKG